MKTIKYWIILIFIIGCQNTKKQKIENQITPISKEEKIEVFYNEYDSIFLDLIRTEVVTNPEDKKFISDITKLESVALVHCDTMNIHYRDSIDGNLIELKLKLKRFEKENHRIVYDEEMKESNWCKLIGGKKPWGGFYGHPKSEVDKIEFSVNGKLVEMKNEFRDIFNLEMCYDDYQIYFNPNPLLKYDVENKVFYLYIKGGNAADTYFGKFIFDHNQYIKRYLLHYVQLSKTASFRDDFKGF